MIRLVLASASPARKRVLTDAGIPPIVHVSNVDEEALTEALGEITPAELCLVLAQAKARDVAAQFAGQRDTVIVGCDSVFELDGIAYGKPLTPDVAFERISGMVGRSGTLRTGHWVVRDGREVGCTTSTTIVFDEMGPSEIAAYVATGEPLNVAGAFTLDGLAAPFVRRIDGDPSNVMGISLPTLRDLVSDLGISWSDLWASA